MNAFDSEMQKIQHELYGKLFSVTAGLALILVIFLALTYKSAPAKIPKNEAPNSKKENKKNKKE